MKTHLFLVLLLAFVFSLATEGLACTSAVISGKITPDGRPLLWKNRDTDAIENGVMYFSTGRYPFIGIVNSGVKNPKSIWAGTNSVGFSLMNTQSYNLVKVEKNEERGASNGQVIRRALEVCATVDDFRHFLDTLAKPTRIEANFGVIDAQGGAAMFEVDYYKYILFDANNPKDAPCGYIVRTNFSFTGEVNQGAGYVRYMQADKLLMPAAAMNLITPAWIFNELARSFIHPLLGIDLRSGDFNRPQTTGWFVDQDFIPRHSTGSSVVVQGVRPKENPELTTMWTVLGYPPVSVAVPVWLKGADKRLPQLLLPDAEGTHPLALGKKVLSLTQKVFAYNQGMGSDRYLNWELLYNRDKTGYMQRLSSVEESVWIKTQPQLDAWRAAGAVDVKQLHQLYDELDSYVAGEYRKLFGL